MFEFAASIILLLPLVSVIFHDFSPYPLPGVAVNVTSSVTVPPGALSGTSPTAALTVPITAPFAVYVSVNVICAELMARLVVTLIFASPFKVKAHSIVPSSSGVNTIVSPPLSRVRDTSSYCPLLGATFTLITSLSLISSPDFISTLPRCRTLISAAFALSIE